MLVAIQLPVDPAAFNLNGKTVDQAIDEANELLAKEAKKHFGAGKVTVGRLPDGRFYFRHLALGTMVRVPDELATRAAETLKHSIVAAVVIGPPPNMPAVAGVHGLWARQSFVDKFVASESLLLEAC